VEAAASTKEEHEENMTNVRLAFGSSHMSRGEALFTLPPLKKILNPHSYFRFVKNLPGVFACPPGNFDSPLLDPQALGPNDSNLPFDEPGMSE